MEEYLPVSEIAKKYDVTIQAVYKWIASGKIDFKIEKIPKRKPRKILSTEDVDRYLSIGIR